MFTTARGSTTRKLRVLALAGLTAAVLVLTACTGGSPSPKPSGDTVRPNITGILPSADLSLYDPMVAGPANTQGPVMQEIYEGLVAFPPGQVTLKSIEPSLATKWTTSKDGLTWTFTLRKGVQFQGGYGEMTSADVVFSYERQLDPKAGGSYSGEFANVKSVTATDAHTVKIVLKEANPYFLVTVGNYHGGYIVSKKAVQKLGKAFTTQPIGTGPFQLTQYSPTNRVVFTAFDKYWGGKPKLATLTYLFVADGSTQLTSLQSGEVQFGRIAQADGDVASAKASGLDVKLMSPIAWNLHLNLNDSPALKDLRVRQALAYGTDRKALAAAFGSTVATPSDALLPASAAGALTSKDIPKALQYNYSVSKAKSLLAAAGYASGLSFDIEVSDTSVYPVMWQVLQAQWAKIGVTLNLKQTDHQTFNTDADAGHLSMVVHGGSRVPLAVLFLQEWYGADGDSNYSHYGTAMPGIDNLLDKAIKDAVANDDAGANKLYKQAQIQLLTDLPAIPLVSIFTPDVKSSNVDLGYKVNDSLVYAFQITAKSTVTK